MANLNDCWMGSADERPPHSPSVLNLEAEHVRLRKIFVQRLKKEKTQMDCEMENEYNAHCDINSTHCYLNLPTDMEEDNPLDIENIKEKQDQDDVLQHNLFQFPAQPSSATSISSADSVDAYPLVEDQDPTTTSEVPPAVKMPHTKRLTPTSIMVVDTISAVRSRVLLKVLFDPGSTATLINRKCLPRHCKTCPISQGRKINTLAGSCATKEMVVMRNLRLPELDKNRVVDQQKALVFDGTCKYDVILGADFLLKSGIDIKYSSGIIEWFDSELPMRDPHQLDDKDYIAMMDVMEVQREAEEIFGMDWYDPTCYASEIMDAKYGHVSTDDVAEQLTHLTADQRNDMKVLFRDFKKLFDGTLGVYPHRKFHIDLIPGAKPKHSRPYPVPRIHLAAFKKELDRLVNIGVLSPTGASEWGSPTFITPKKDNTVRWVSDLRELNKVVLRKQYPLPIITDILKKRSGYKFFSKLDISMQYYTFELDEESKDLTTIVTPFGKYRYNVLPMGLKCSPDFAQETMECVFRGIDDAEVYLDDIGAFSPDWEHHLKLLRTILTRLQENGFTVNPLKCDWAVQETDWLGYWLTPTGLKPWKKKIDAVLRMEAPKSLKELRGFIGMVNYYRDMWPHRAGVLAPLTAKTGAPKKGEKQAKFIPRATGSLPFIWLNAMGSLPFIWLNAMGSLPFIWLNAMGSLPFIWLNATGSLPFIWLNAMGSLPFIWLNATGSLPLSLGFIALSWVHMP
jgi:hypothetical protein